MPLSWGELGVVVVEAGGGGGGTAELEGGGTTGADEGGAGTGLVGGTTGGEEGVSTQRWQVVIVLVIKLVFTMTEVLPLTTVVEVTGQLVNVVYVVKLVVSVSTGTVVVPDSSEDGEEGVTDGEGVEDGVTTGVVVPD